MRDESLDNNKAKSPALVCVRRLHASNGDRFFARVRTHLNARAKLARAHTHAVRVRNTHTCSTRSPEPSLRALAESRPTPTLAHPLDNSPPLISAPPRRPPRVSSPQKRLLLARTSPSPLRSLLPSLPLALSLSLSRRRCCSPPNLAQHPRSGAALAALVIAFDVATFLFQSST